MIPRYALGMPATAITYNGLTTNFLWKWRRALDRVSFPTIGINQSHHRKEPQLPNNDLSHSIKSPGIL